eukprot:Rhum_TRINITY_DN17089_c0_g1::Rhum_TRINITY_DN17089_c0_g1_i1::g.165225::m.165225
MGMLLSHHRPGGLVAYDQDCHDTRDEDTYVMDQQAIAAHADIPGPPSSMTLYANVLLKRQEDGYRLVYDLVTLAPEQRRLILILLHVSSQKGVRDSTVGRCLLQSCLQVAGFIDYSRHHPYGPGPFFSSRVSMLVPSIRVQHIRPSAEPGAGGDVEIVDEWSVVPDPSLPAGSGHRDMFSVSLSHDKPVSIPPDMALLSMTCWMDGWKRMHVEMETLPTFAIDAASGVCIVQTEYSFGLRESKQQPKEPKWVRQKARKKAAS